MQREFTIFLGLNVLLLGSLLGSLVQDIFFRLKVIAWDKKIYKKYIQLEQKGFRKELKKINEEE